PPSGRSTGHARLRRRRLRRQRVLGPGPAEVRGLGPHAVPSRRPMLDRSTPAYWLARFTMGLSLLALAGAGVVRQMLGQVDQIGLGTLLAGVFGFHLSLSAVTPLVRLLTRNAHRRSRWSDAARDAFARASLPRRVYYLLASVA